MDKRTGASAFLAVALALSASASITEKGHAKVRLWEGGPYWATTNLGAEEPWEYGLYFWWGDTVGYRRESDVWVASDGSSQNFQFHDDPISQQTYGKSSSTLQSEGWTASAGILAPAHDPAHVQWGGGWRMPTKQEIDDLCYNKCDWTWTTTNGVSGYVVRGRDGYASASIFLPAAGYGYGTSLYAAGLFGYYWLSIPNSNDNYSSWSLEFNLGYHDTYDNWGRSHGQSVRPVQGFAENMDATQSTPEFVPYAWLRGYYPEISDENEAYEAAANATAKNGRPVWECYVAGLDPTDKTDDFVATIEMVDGVPQISVGGRGERSGRVYTVEGKENLGDSWGPTNSMSRFFHIKASVEE